MGRWLVVLGLAGALLAGFAFADELEDRMREAREQLDQAAERLAELNRMAATRLGEVVFYPAVYVEEENP